MHDRLWFDLGWDYASYDVRLPEDCTEQVRIGHREGKARFKRPIGEADRFVRKWLQLRYNALHRGRQFDADVTPSFLREIDTILCPVTHEELTHGTLRDSDWSVDRIVNDGAYCRSNLVIMSTRANQAKSSMSFMGILEQVGATDCNPALKTVEWQRLLGVIWSTNLNTGDIPTNLELVVPMPPFYPSHLPRPLSFELQEFLCLVATDRACEGEYLPRKIRPKRDLWMKELKRASTFTGQKVLQKLLTKMERKAPDVPTPLFLMWTDSIYRLFKDWIDTGPQFDSPYFKSGFDRINAEDIERNAQSMHRDTKGFISFD